MNYTTEMKVYDALGAIMWTAMLFLLMAYQETLAISTTQLAFPLKEEDYARE